MTSYAPRHRRTAHGRRLDRCKWIPPIICSPARPFPILRVIVNVAIALFVVIVIFIVIAVVIEQALPVVFPPSPPLPLPSSHHP